MMCGASVVASRWVITAGHCVSGSEDDPGNFRIKAGLFAEQRTDEFEQFNVSYTHFQRRAWRTNLIR